MSYWRGHEPTLVRPRGERCGRLSTMRGAQKHAVGMRSGDAVRNGGQILDALDDDSVECSIFRLGPRSGPQGFRLRTSLVADPAQLDPPSLVRVRRIVMSEVDQPALVTPHVLPVNEHVVAWENRGALSDGHVVVHEHRLRRTREANDETLVHTGRTAVIRENARHHTLGGDLDGRSFFGVVALDSEVVGCCRRHACRRDEQKEQGRPHRDWPPSIVRTTFPVLCSVSTYRVAAITSSIG